MAAEIFLQGVMQDMRGRMGPADAGSPGHVDSGRDRRAELQMPAAKMSNVQDEAVFLLGIKHFKAHAGADQLAGIADLPAALAVKRRAIEHDLDGPVVAVFGDRL